MEIIVLFSLGWLAKAFVDRKKVPMSDPLAKK